MIVDHSKFLGKNNMEQHNNARISPITLTAIISQIIFIIILGATIFSTANQANQPLAPNAQPVISIDNFSSQDVNLSNNHINNILHNLTYTVELNTSNLNIPDSTATVRDGSTIWADVSSTNFTLLSFIVDIPNLEQSYQIYYYFNPNTDSLPTEDTDTSLPINPYVLCLTDQSQIIYPDFDCHSAFSPDMHDSITQEYANLLKSAN